MVGSVVDISRSLICETRSSRRAAVGALVCVACGQAGSGAQAGEEPHRLLLLELEGLPLAGRATARAPTSLPAARQPVVGGAVAVVDQHRLDPGGPGRCRAEVGAVAPGPACGQACRGDVG